MFGQTSRKTPKHSNILARESLGKTRFPGPRMVKILQFPNIQTFLRGNPSGKTFDVWPDPKHQAGLFPNIQTFSRGAASGETRRLAEACAPWARPGQGLGNAWARPGQGLTRKSPKHPNILAWNPRGKRNAWPNITQTFQTSRIPENPKHSNIFGGESAGKSQTSKHFGTAWCLQRLEIKRLTRRA